MSGIRTYVRLWFLICVLLTYEFIAINYFHDLSVINGIQHMGFLKNVNLVTLPGKRISLFLGWAGFLIMLLTNLYSIRKRFFPSQNLGSMAGWLNFHIFCGLVGPTFILFHTDFKIGGLVAISFWSMVISFSSGVVGRYFYLQIVSGKAELEQYSERCWGFFKKRFTQGRSDLEGESLDQQLASIQNQILAMAGANPSSNQGIVHAIMGSMTGDLRLRFGLPKLAHAMPSQCAPLLKDYAVLRRRAQYLSQFQQVMGYWHSFHMPFAFLMYGFAVIHIITALIMMVPE